MDFGNCLLATTHAIILEKQEQAKVIVEKEQDKTVVIDGECVVYSGKICAPFIPIVSKKIV